MKFLPRFGVNLIGNFFKNKLKSLHWQKNNEFEAIKLQPYHIGSTENVPLIGMDREVSSNKCDITSESNKEGNGPVDIKGGGGELVAIDLSASLQKMSLI